MQSNEHTVNVSLAVKFWTSDYFHGNKTSKIKSYLYFNTVIFFCQMATIFSRIHFNSTA